jgi:lysophospholipase L1-like esterase
VATKTNLNQADGIHPTGAGYTIVVTNLWPIVEPLLKK